jgi:hypothetical protein
MLLPVDLQLAILHPVEGPNDPAPVIRHLMPLQNVDVRALFPLFRCPPSLSL